MGEYNEKYNEDKNNKKEINKKRNYNQTIFPQKMTKYVYYKRKNINKKLIEFHNISKYVNYNYVTIKYPLNLLLLIMIIILLFPSLYFSKIIILKLRKLDFYSEINITIRGTGNQYIISKGIEGKGSFRGSLPDQLYVNGEQTTVNAILYNLTNEENIATLRWNSPLTSANSMFNGVSNATKIDVSNFDGTKLKDMTWMFANCDLLTSINFNNFDTSHVTDFSGLFNNDFLLISLNLSNFNTTIVTNMNNMFSNCRSLISLNLSNFDTTIVTNMNTMFSNCHSLISLNLNFDTRNVTSMYEMFFNCHSLISLNLSNFNTTIVTNMRGMFYNCHSLIFINLNSFTEAKLSSLENIFYNISNSLIYCINEENTPKITSAIKLISQNNECSNICFQESKIILIDKKVCILPCHINNISFPYFYYDKCVEFCPKKTNILSYDFYCEDLNCSKYYDYNQKECLDQIPPGYYLNDSKTIDKCHPDCKTCSINSINCLSCSNNSKFLDLGKCVSECRYGYYNDSNNNKICKCSYNNKCKECSNISNEKNLCISCNNEDGYYPKNNNTILNNVSFIDCFKELEGYFLDSDNIYKLCYKNCKKCLKEGNESNNNCLECIDNHVLLNDLYNNTNCYKECINRYYYFDTSNQYNCTIGKECPIGYKLIINKNKCIDNCTKDNIYQFEFNNSCYNICPN